MDYSKFVDAILDNDEETLAEQAKVITAVLIKFLRVRLDVGKQDAEDCAQNTLLIAIEKIRNDKLNNPDVIISYLFTTAKHEYFTSLSRNKESKFNEVPDKYFNKPDQLYNLLEKEKLDILRRCIDALKSDYRKYIEYWFQHADHETAVVANHFGISVNNAWTKKHRIINVLKKCCQKKIQL